MRNQAAKRRSCPPAADCMEMQLTGQTAEHR